MQGELPLRLRDELRRKCRAIHEQLERLVRACLADLAGYVTFLEASLAWAGAFESQLVELGLLRSVERLPALQEDLTRLGVSPRRVAMAPFLPTSLGFAYGVAYVFEGSTLGGPEIAKKVEAELAVASPRYLRIGADPTQRHFGEFVRRLDAFGTRASALEREDALQGAQHAFASFSRVLLFLRGEA